jgi:hypothetical protein
MPGGATWSWAFQVVRSRAFRVPRVRSGSEWSVYSASSEPLGPDKRSEQIDDDEGGHRDCDERHERAFQMTSQAKTNA